MADENAWRQQLAEKLFGEELTPGFARGTLKRRPDASTDSGVAELPPVVAAPDLPPPLPRVMDAPRLPSADFARAPTPTAPLVSRRTGPLRFLTGIGAIAAALAAGWLARGTGNHTVVYVPVRMAAARPVNALPPVSVPVARSTSVAPQRSTKIAQTASLRTEPKRQGIDLRPRENQAGGSESSRDTGTNSSAARSRRLHHAAGAVANAAPAAHSAIEPSFECRRPVSEVTRAICGDRQLAALDRRLAARFSLLDRSVDPATIQALHHGETAFLNARQSCADKACLADSYRQRLRDLDSIEP